MMAAAWIGILPLSMALGLFGFPLGMPPLPEDPLLSRVAPAECVWYLQSAGMAEPDAESENQTEQLLAEPEVQQLVQVLKERIPAAFRYNAGPGEDEMVDDAQRLVLALATRPLALCLEKIDIKPGGPSADGFAIVNLGEQKDEIEASLERLLARLFRGQEFETIEDADLRWQKLPLPPPVPSVAWAIKGHYLIVGFGPTAGGDVIRRAGSEPPAWLDAIQDEAGIERVATISYLNLAKINEIARPFLPPGEMQRIFDAAGLASLEYLSSITGLDEQGSVTRSVLALDRNEESLFRIFEGNPLSRKDLRTVPENAVAALALRLDLDRAIETLIDLATVVEEGAGEEFEEELDRFAIESGVHLRRDIAAALGDTWVAYASPSDGGFPWTGAVLTVTVKDHTILQAAEQKMVNFLLRELSPPARPGQHMPLRSRHRVEIRKTTFADQTIRFMNFIGEDSPVAPAWCLTEDRLVVGLYPQAVKGYLGRNTEHGFADDSLAEVEAVEQAFSADHEVQMISYVDTPALFRTVYPLLQVGMQLGAAKWQREGLDINISHLPSAHSIAEHLLPTVMVGGRSEAGLESTTWQSLPGGNFVGSVPVLAGLSIPAILSGRDAAQRSQDMNRLKQIALAMHTYHDARRTFPPARFGADKESAGLSWRVAILPYLEEEALYRKFRLDEPWDSPHNLELAEEMPEIYRSALDVRPHYTPYVALRAENSIFPSGEKATDGTGMREITDGTSHTILVARVSGDKSVPWTKPDDYDFKLDGVNPGLFDQRGNLLAGFADGSVHIIRAGVDRTVLQALVTRNGGEEVGHEALHPRPHAKAVAPVPRIAPPPQKR